MARPSMLSDPKIYQEVLEKLALGVPQALIARTLQIPETTVNGWKKRKDFSRDLALKVVENVTEPIQAVKKANPLAYLERHPETREAWAPPKIVDQQLTVNTITVELPKGFCRDAVEVDVPSQLMLPEGE